MDDRIAKYINDILICISEIESALERFGKQYEMFESDFIFRKFVERNIEITGTDLKNQPFHTDYSGQKNRRHTQLCDSCL